MKRLVVAIAILLSPLLYDTSLGCSCTYQPNPTPEEIKAERLKAFNRASAVFSGKVIELEENKVKFRVEKIWKGEPVDEITMVIQDKDEKGKYVMSSCDYRYKFGEKYLVYAYGSPDELITYVCTRTALLKNADQEMRGLDEIRQPEIRNTEEGAIAVTPKSNNSFNPTRDSVPFMILPAGVN
jgi:hypothetical protein